MKAIDFTIPGILVWVLQLMISDLLAIDTVRPDFCVILILYWSLTYGRTFGICSGFLFGLVLDLSSSSIFFGLSPITYTISGYLGGVLFKNRARLNPFYFSLSWATILLFQFFVYCSVQYQDLWEINRQIFWGKWLGTSIYTISFVAVLQFIYPLNKIDNVKS